MDHHRRPLSEEGIEFLHAGPMVNTGEFIWKIKSDQVVTLYDAVNYPTNMTYDPYGYSIKYFYPPKPPQGK